MGFVGANRYDGRVNTNDTARQNETFKDLDLAILKHPSTGDIIKKTGAEAIKRSLRNLLFLKKGELGFNPNKGSGIDFILFEPMTPATVELLQAEIINTITAYEPRVRVIEIIVSDDDILDRNGINVQILFTIRNFEEPIKLDVFLERVR